MESKLKLIVDYIHEKKGAWVTPIPPMNGVQEMKMNVMAQIAKDYFDTQK